MCSESIEKISSPVTISNISCLVMYPFPSKSYMVKAHLSFCSNFPLEVMLSAHRNSLSEQDYNINFNNYGKKYRIVKIFQIQHK